MPAVIELDMRQATHEAKLINCAVFELGRQSVKAALSIKQFGVMWQAIYGKPHKHSGTGSRGRRAPVSKRMRLTV